MSNLTSECLGEALEEHLSGDDFKLVKGGSFQLICWYKNEFTYGLVDYPRFLFHFTPDYRDTLEALMPFSEFSLIEPLNLHVLKDGELLFDL